MDLLKNRQSYNSFKVILIDKGGYNIFHIEIKLINIPLINKDFIFYFNVPIFLWM